jgi:hypothetical protein
MDDRIKVKLPPKPFWVKPDEKQEAMRQQLEDMLNYYFDELKKDEAND